MLVDLQELLQKEAENLASYATRSIDSQGRIYSEGKADERLPFQKDRDRIIHCKAFRRLNEKTQVFVAGSGDHYRTRLSHSIEVSQVGRDICRAMKLNEDLGEAIALAHDLGHPPFAHAGQETLNEIMKGYGLHFEHNEQSRRVVEKLEKLYPNFDGLNLTLELIDGLMKHQTPWNEPKLKFVKWAHLEGQVINLADEIAYTSHDIDDGLRADIISFDQLKKLNLWQKALEVTEKNYGKIDDPEILKYRAISSLLSLLLIDVCEYSALTLKEKNIIVTQDVRTFDGDLIEFSPEVKNELADLRKFLYEEFYFSPPVLKQFKKAKEIMETLFEHYLAHPSDMSEKFSIEVAGGEKREIVVKDYLAGMTDGYLLGEFERIQ